LQSLQFSGAAPVKLSDAVEETERQTILNALELAGFNRRRTAESLGISLRTLHYKMSRHGLHGM
jgi:two-component system response regulator AtoC